MRKPYSALECVIVQAALSLFAAFSTDTRTCFGQAALDDLLKSKVIDFTVSYAQVVFNENCWRTANDANLRGLTSLLWVRAFCPTEQVPLQHQAVAPLHFSSAALLFAVTSFFVGADCNSYPSHLLKHAQKKLKECQCM